MEYAISVLNNELEDLQTQLAKPHLGIVEHSNIRDAIDSCKLSISNLTYLSEGEHPKQTTEPVLNICDVSKQRELLLAYEFREWTKPPKGLKAAIGKKIDEYLADNCC